MPKEIAGIGGRLIQHFSAAIAWKTNGPRKINPTGFVSRHTEAHMQTRRPFLTTAHQRRRLALLALAMLSWISAVLFTGRQVTARALRQRRERISLDRLTRLTVQLLIVRAAELSKRRAPRRLTYFRRGRDLRRRHFFRSLLGARLRRALASKDIASRIRKLTYVLRNLDAFARRLSKRRLTRLWPVATRPPAAALVSLHSVAPAVADSS